MSSDQLITTLRTHALEAARLHDQSRRLLVESVRAGVAAGLTQRQISVAIGRSQPEVSRLLRFHGRSPLARSVEASRRSIVSTLARAGGTRVRVFGSVARGDDRLGSDVDLLVDFAEPPSLLELSRVEAELGQKVGASVDIVPSGTLRSHLIDRVLAEAVPL